MSDTSEHLPIKVVIPSEGDIHPPRKTTPRRKDFTARMDCVSKASRSAIEFALSRAPMQPMNETLAMIAAA